MNPTVDRLGAQVFWLSCFKNSWLKLLLPNILQKTDDSQWSKHAITCCPNYSKWNVAILVITSDEERQSLAVWQKQNTGAKEDPNPGLELIKHPDHHHYQHDCL